MSVDILGSRSRTLAHLMGSDPDEFSDGYTREEILAPARSLTKWSDSDIGYQPLKSERVSNFGGPAFRDPAPASD